MAKPSAALKKQKKIWVAIAAPKDFGYRVVGECPVYEQEQMLGRTVQVNLAQVTGDMKKQNMNVTFIVTDVKNNKANTVVKNLILQMGSIRRLVRPGSQRIDDSFAATTKDRKQVRIKPLLVTKTKIKSSVATALRAEMIREIKKMIEKNTFDDLVIIIANFNIQKELRDRLSKIYPLKTVQIKWFGFESEKKKRGKKEETAAEPAPEAESVEEAKAQVKLEVKEEAKEEEPKAEEAVEEKPKTPKKKKAEPEVVVEEPKQEE